MKDKTALLESLKNHVREASANPDFVHHKWFVEYHLEVMERIAIELLEHYPQADRDVVIALVWMHDYGKILDFDNQYAMTLSAGPAKMRELGFDEAFTNTVVGNVETLDKKLELDLNQAAIEVQIASSADGCSHMTGPFMNMWWYENAQKPYKELMEDHKKKAAKDWERKIVLPEARAAFEKHYQVIMQQAGVFPDKFLA